MHSRIFQIDTTPIDYDEYIVEEDVINSGFLDTVADYIDCDTDRNYDISWLVKHLSSTDKIVLNKLEDSIMFKQGFKQRYFEKAHKDFELSSKITLEEFSDNSTTKIFNITNAIDNRYGFYVYSEEDRCVTFDYFVRNLTENTKYYIGATIDYHS